MYRDDLPPDGFACDPCKVQAAAHMTRITADHAFEADPRLHMQVSLCSVTCCVQLHFPP